MGLPSTELSIFFLSPSLSSNNSATISPPVAKVHHSLEMPCPVPVSLPGRWHPQYCSSSISSTRLPSPRKDLLFPLQVILPGRRRLLTLLFVKLFGIIHFLSGFSMTRLTEKRSRKNYRPATTGPAKHPLPASSTPTTPNCSLASLRSWVHRGLGILKSLFFPLRIPCLFCRWLLTHGFISGLKMHLIKLWHS